MRTEEQSPSSLVLGTAAERARRRRRAGRLAVVLAATAAAIGGLAAAWSSTVARPAEPSTARATDVDEAIASAGVVLDHWWGERAAELGLAWTPVGARLTDGDGTVGCEGEPLVLDDRLTDNAFAAWCPSDGPAVAYDPARFPADRVSTMVVLAHEWGHVVQFTNPHVDLPTIDPLADRAERELQADCFAGAWAAEHVVGAFHGLMLADVGSFGDPSWIPLEHEHAHGTPDERRRAYETGVAGGVEACLPPAFDPR